MTDHATGAGGTGEGAHAPRLGEGALSPEALTAANIHPRTGLATDYLNHFNEVVMLLDMLPDMPDCAEDVLAWEPCGYETHFARSRFAGKALAIAAWRAAPRALKAHLETIVCSIDAEVARAQAILRAGGEDAPARAAALAETEIKPLIAAASGAIHGVIDADALDAADAAQADVDAVLRAADA